MRIVILGDFHLDPDNYELTVSAMEDIAECKPDLVIPLGDFGSQQLIGSTSGLAEAKSFLDRIGAPLRPILGNHDLERESGSGEQMKGTVQEHFVRMFGLEKPYGVLEYEHVRFFFASTDPQAPDSCYDVQECFVSDEQFNWIAGKLKERPNVPVVFFTHAPPIGCGLRTVPRVHVRSTNAYLDQNHDPYRWYDMFKNTPEIILWFSAHYHLSHTHADSRTDRFGTRFFITGVHGTCTRDGLRQSRILDIDEHDIRVRTLDHIQRTVTEKGGWVFNGSVQALSEQAGVSLTAVSSYSVGEAPAVQGGIVPLSSKRYIVSTGDGFSWETEPAVEAVFGTYHIGPALSAMTVSGDDVWMAWEHSIGRSDRHSPWRFVRMEKGEWPFTRQQFDHKVSALASRASGGVWAVVGTELYRLGHDPLSDILTAERESGLPEPCRQLIAEQDKLWLLAESGALSRYDERNQQFVTYMDQVLAWDAWHGHAVGAVMKDGSVCIVSEAGDNRYSHPVPAAINPNPGEPLSAQVLSLGQHHAVVTVNGQAYYVITGGSGTKYRKLDTGEGRVTAVSRAVHAEADRICASFVLALTADNKEKRPKLQEWQAVLG